MRDVLGRMGGLQLLLPEELGDAVREGSDAEGWASPWFEVALDEPTALPVAPLPWAPFCASPSEPHGAWEAPDAEEPERRRRVVRYRALVEARGFIWAE